MTVAATIRKAGPYTGNGATTAFPFSFKIFAGSELVVTQTDLDSVETELTLTIDYTVSLNADQDANPGGTATMLAAPATGILITLTSDVVQSQTVTLTNGGGFYPAVISNALDRLTILTQQLAEQVSRTLKWPVSSAGATLPVPEANKFIGWAPSGGALVNLAGTGVGDAVNVGYSPSGTGAVDTNVQAKLREVVSVVDFGAVGDGTTNDSTAITNFNAASGFKFVPTGTYLGSTIADTDLDGPFFGRGQIKTSASNKRAPMFSAIKAAPSSLGTESSITTAFNGDMSKCQFPVEHRITGAATLGQPTTGYLYTPEAMPHYTYLYNTSGHNQSTSNNTGRTGVAAYRVKAYHNGQGDLAAFNASVFVTGAKAGATSFLANPAGVLFNGDMTAGQAGVYLNPRELELNDGGFDVAGIGDVVRLNRTNETGALSVWWEGYRVQSTGTKAIDVAFGAKGLVKIGLDLSFATLPASGTYEEAAITLKAGQRIYFDVSATDASGLSRYPASLATTYMRYDSATTSLQFVVGNASSLQVYNDQVIVNNKFRHMNFDLGFFAATPTTKQAVAGSRGGNAALASLITALSNYGLVTDSSTA